MNNMMQQNFKNDNIVNSNTNIQMREIPLDSMDLLSNQKKTNNFNEMVENEEEISEEEISDVENMSEISSENDNLEQNNDQSNNFNNEKISEIGDYDDDDFQEDDEIEINNEIPYKNQESFEDIQKEKQELLFKLNRLEKVGSKPSRNYTMDSRIEDIRSEYKTLKKQKELDRSIKFSREMLMACIGGIEYLNGKFDPFDVKLEGWSESIMENVDNYDDVFEELYYKYNEKVEVAPEIKLIMMVGGSGFMYHLTNSLFKSAVPNVNDILKQNPDLMNNIQQATMNTMQNNASNRPSNNMPNKQPSMGGGMFQNMMSGMMPPMPQGPPQNNIRRPSPNEMRGPTGVDDVISKIHGKKKINLGV